MVYEDKENGDKVRNVFMGDVGTTRGLMMLSVGHSWSEKTGETCPVHGTELTDIGRVELMVFPRPDDEESEAGVIMELDPGEALILANRLQRAASLCMEWDEDAADPSRQLEILARDSA